MNLSLSNRMRDLACAFFLFSGLFVGLPCQANSPSELDQTVYLGQAAVGFGDLSPMSVALIAVLAIAGILILALFVRRSIRRSRLSSSRAQRHGTSGIDALGTDPNLLASSRPEKTEVVRTIVIGSEHDVDVRFASEGVSTRHAELLVLRQVDSSPLMPLEPIYYIRDMASARGIEVLRDGDWMRFQADVVLDDEKLRIGEVETSAGEINQLAIQSKVAMQATDEAP